MGVVGSRIDDGAPIFLRDQYRLSIKSLHITNAKKKTLLNIAPSSFPCTRFNAKRDTGDDGPVDYIQDPVPFSYNTDPIYILRLTNDEPLLFNFTFVIRQTPHPSAADNVVNGLTFIFGSSHKELENLVTREFHADPNLHKNANVELVGDFSTLGSPSVEFDWSWTWMPPKANEDRGGGWRTSCSFVEYDQRAHRLNTLAEFSFWVQNVPRPRSPVPVPNGAASLAPPKMRVASSRSINSRLSGDNEPDIPEDDVLESAKLSPQASNLQEPLFEVNCQRPGEDMSIVEDGPLFRATIKALEQKTGNMRTQMKKVLRKAEAAKLAQGEANMAVTGFIEALREASLVNANAIQPALDHYFEKIATEILRYEQSNARNLQKLVIDPMTKLYNIDIKQAESKKRDFEEESRDYYAYVSRYLGQRSDSLKGKKRTESDSKYQSKTKEFELRRFDYNSFVQDLHGGRKEQDVLSQLTMFADAQAKNFLETSSKVQGLLPELEALSREVKEADKAFKWKRTEREEKRRALEKSTATYVEPESVPLPLPSPTLGSSQGFDSGQARGEAVAFMKRTISGSGTRPDNLRSPTSNQQDATTKTAVVGVPLTNPSPDRFKGYRDIQENDTTKERRYSEVERRKEGLLWALSRPGSHADPKGLNKQAWHKYWVVLAGGKLSEYSNWKQRLDLHNDPIDLRLASVREARNQERRFCFEVITPHYKRVYQATSEDDMQSWIVSISNALKSTLEGGNSVTSFDTSSISESSMKKDIGSVLTGKTLSSYYHSHSYHSSTNPLTQQASEIGRRTTVGSRKSVPDAPPSASSQLLNLIRAADESNKLCADCCSTERVDWVSINLGVVLCIECSGVHRSLGTHISKIRSLTLDSTSFTPDITALLLIIGNTLSNSVWEATLPPGDTKITELSTREQRLKYITAKYVARIYIKALPSPDDILLTGVKTRDTSAVLHALACSANLNIKDRSRGTHILHLALAATDPAQPSTAMAPPPSPATSQKIAFPLPELLLQNGSEIPEKPAQIQLSAAAEAWLKAKIAKRDGTGSTLLSSSSSSSSPSPMMPVPGTLRDSQAENSKESERGREKNGQTAAVYKRNSSSVGRFGRSGV